MPGLRSQKIEATRVTERVEAEEALRRSEERYRRLVELSPMTIAIHRAGRIIYANPAGVRLMGAASDAEILGRPILDFVHPDFHGLVLERMRLVAAGGYGPPIEERLVRLDGEAIDVEVTSIETRDAGGPATQVIVQDITERKRSEEALRQALDKARKAERLKSQFLANMSHEIRTPLNIIKGFSSVIRQHLREAGDQSQDRAIEGMERAIQRLLRTIHGILDLSKIEAQSLELQVQEIPLAAFLERQVADYEMLARERGLTLRCRIDARGVIVRFDEYCLAQALGNLLQNAIKFTERGAVEVRLLGSGPDLRVEVADTGIGMEQGYLARLFEPFSQEHNGGRRFDGSGLGLSLVKRYLELNGACISVESQKGEGTTFRILFAGASRSASAATACEPEDEQLIPP